MNSIDAQPHVPVFISVDTSTVEGKALIDRMTKRLSKGINRILKEAIRESQIAAKEGR